jgi:predicted nuclease of restriction endonuclease-like (RecB) superfamily
VKFNSLVKQINNVQKTLQATAEHAINISLTIRNWLIGHYIVEFEQHGEDKAKYGTGLLQKLEQKLKTKGMIEPRFREFRRFYSAYPQIGNEIRRTVSVELGTAISQTASTELEAVPAKTLLHKLPYSHLLLISSIEEPLKRNFYEMESIKGNWSFRELERQINSLYFERSGLSKNKKALSNLINKKAMQLQPSDVINTPVSLEFLGLNEKALITENDLEQAILDNLQKFLLEMGYGFCFEARQKRILIDDDYFYVDLVFYHRVLKCHFIVELKTDKFKHEYASQLNMYLNYFKHEEMTKGDNPPVGLLLCTEKGNTQVKYALAGLDKNIFVKKYLIKLPNEKAIKEYISKEIGIWKGVANGE